MKRRKPLRRSTTPIKARKADKSKRRFANLRDEAYQGWIRQQPCVISGCLYNRDEIHAAHVKARGAGGVDRGNLVPLCARHHRFQHDTGMRSFQAFYHIDLAAVAAALDVQYEKENRP